MLGFREFSYVLIFTKEWKKKADSVHESTIYLHVRALFKELKLGSSGRMKFLLR